MSVLVRFGGHKAILRWGEWWSADKDLERKLNEATSSWIRATGGPSLADRDQERAVAQEIGGRFGGNVMIHVKSRTGKSAQRFLEQRQMVIEFPSSSPGNSRRVRPRRRATESLRES
jgi:hypothetical protein